VLTGDTNLGAGIFTFSDFADNAWGLEVQGSLIGAGVDQTVLQMVPRTSTKSGMIPTAAMSTNPLSLVTGTGSPVLSGFTVAATDQGHLYNGLRLNDTTNARISDVKVVGIPGNSVSPPGETFVINDYSSDGNIYTNIEIDGRDVAAAGMGINSTTNLTINGLTVRNCKYSGAITFWKSSDVVVNDLDVANNHKSINMEQNTGSFTFNRPRFGSTTDTDMDLSTFSTLGSTKITINDPRLEPGQQIRIRAYQGAHAYGGPNQQNINDIKVYVDGVDKTAELVRWI